ncbi:serine/threonine-protein kinase PknK [Haliangium ochraceum]|uniref:Serine/threonine protein kinase n=1 Tax=Haliangium ochraceum (strain DSM 14365 / JCM 11303 / SMP-2) TaxID=502025 RepID=D0LXU9_HALO1|nr:protein kinase [Haliangium ochraceum]ACY14304.1 serine/threonine protein kinase [Haliangium ochraceum DSM 14365]
MSPPPSRPPLPRDIPEHIAGFTLLAPLGRGGTASVWRARARSSDSAGTDAASGSAPDAGTGAEVALKLYEEDDGRHLRESEALRRVAPRWAPRLLAHGHHHGRPYLVTELIRGRSFEELVRARPGPADAAAHIAALAHALDAIHDAGVLHRDLKPAHVFGEGTSVRLIDFGLARLLDVPGDEPASPAASIELTRNDERIGTPWYMAPEQCQMTRTDARTDLYALGVVAFELLTGRRPFEGDIAEVATAQVSRRPPAASSFAALPRAVDAVLRRALAKEPSLRYQRGAELAAELSRAIAEAPAETRGESAADASARVAATPAAHAPASAGPRSARVALLSLPYPGSPVALAAALSADECVAQVDAGRYLIALHQPGAPAADVHAAARAAARLRAALGIPAEAAIVIHSDTVRLRRSARGVKVRGKALDLPALRPPPQLTGTVLTRAAAALLASGASQPLDEAYARLRSDSAAAPAAPALVGREELLQGLLQGLEARELCTVLGDGGMGKSRVLEALSERARARGWTLIALAADDAPGALRDQLARACAQVLGRADAVQPKTPATPAGAHVRSADALAALLVDVGSGVGSGVGPGGPVLVTLDDAHRADPVVLDALERAVALADNVHVVAAAAPSMSDTRPGWVADAPGRRCLTLQPLADDDAHALLRALMAPAEFIPSAVIERLSDAGAGVPLYLVELVHALRTGGSLRRHAAHTELFVAADELAHVSATPLAQRLTRTLLAPLSPLLRRCAALAATIGDPLDAAALDELQHELGGDWLDAQVALQRLADAGVLRAAGGARFRFRHPWLQRAIAAEEPQEHARWHRAALARLPAPELAQVPELARIARHASACGEPAQAWSAWFRLAQAARARHAYVEAEQHYSSALEQLAPDATDPGARARKRETLAGRGHVRYRIQRFADALDDIRAARAEAEAEIAAAAAESEAEAANTALCELLLEEATLLDWIFDIDASAACAERARALADAGVSGARPGLEARLLAAAGRSAYRREALDEAADKLGRAADQAASVGDDDTRIIALLLLAPTLLYLERLDESERRYAEVVTLCQRRGDSFHLAAAHTNRQFLWMRLGRMDRAEADLGRAIDIARALGNALVERIASHNLGELLHWDGRDREALAHAERSLALQRRFSDAHQVPDDPLLVARVHAALAQREAAAALLTELRERWRDGDMAPSARMLAALVTLQLDDAPESAWRAAAAAHLADIDVVDFVFEFHHAAVSAALARGRRDQARAWLSDAAALGERSTRWQPRFDALAARISAADDSANGD